MTEITLVLKELKTHWAVLKDDKQSPYDRRLACKSIIEKSNTLKKSYIEFEVIDMNNTQYAEFAPETYKVQADVIWGMVEDSFGVFEEELLEKWTAVAVRIVTKRLPKERVDSQKFGQIVNATVTHLLEINKSLYK